MKENKQKSSCKQVSTHRIVQLFELEGTFNAAQDTVGLLDHSLVSSAGVLRVHLVNRNAIGCTLSNRNVKCNTVIRSRNKEKGTAKGKGFCYKSFNLYYY